jgi:hypothetical protein
MRSTKAKAYHAYAQDLRTVAAQIRSSVAQNKLLNLANDFDRMAGAAEAIGRSNDLLKTKVQLRI